MVFQRHADHTRCVFRCIFGNEIDFEWVCAENWNVGVTMALFRDLLRRREVVNDIHVEQCLSIFSQL